jgi:phosphatidylinositol alpha-mannosyltransferase
MRRLRIALVHPFCWPEVRRGGERYLHDLGWYLAGQGHEVHVITGTEASSSVSTQDGATFHRYRHRTRLPGLHRSLSREDAFGMIVSAALCRRRFDLVHVLTPTAAIAASGTAHKVVYTVLGHPTQQWMSQRGRRHSWAFAGAVRLASATTALSESAARQVRLLTGRGAHILPPGVRLDQFTADLAPRMGPPRILFPADASQVQKGLDLALAAAGLLLERRPGLRVQLAGPGDHSWVADEPGPHGVGKAARRGMTVIDVLGVGELADLPGRYRAASVTVLPSVNEAFGLVLAESLACGTPVVGHDTAGIPEVVDSCGIGRTVPVGDVGALATALDDVIELSRDPAGPRRCAEHARRWGWRETVGPAHEALYARVLERRKSL